MSFLNTIVEWEGPVIDVRPRHEAAHRAALSAVNHRGPVGDEFWRLVRIGAPDGLRVPHARAAALADYARVRDERLDSTELMALDELQPRAVESLKVLKNLGACHLVSLCRNREGINATLNRLDVWMYFEQKRPLPAESDARVEAIKGLMAASARNLAVAGSVPFAFAAGEAGCRVVGVRSGTAFPRQFRQVGVDVFYESLDELTDALARHDPELQRIGL
ncbi:MAG: hypothetical protein AMXMBFR83_08620 [Phycisphaerae bacterium]